MTTATINLEGDKPAVAFLFSKLIVWLNENYKGSIDFEVTPKVTKIILTND